MTIEEFKSIRCYMQVPKEVTCDEIEYLEHLSGRTLCEGMPVERTVSDENGEPIDVEVCAHCGARWV